MVILEAKSLAKNYGRRVVLRDANLTISPGEIVGITGANGAGKSTLLKILVGLMRPDGGTIRLNAPMGYCPQQILLYDQLTVEEHFRYFLAARRAESSWWQAGMRLADRYRFTAWWNERVAILSEGTRQKLNLSLALAQGPDLLLLDEPYAGFDWETHLLFWAHAAELKQAGKALLIVSHLFHDRSRFDRLLRIAEGRIEEVRP